MADGGEDEYFVPLKDQRVFGAGIKRKRVPFVPASTVEPALLPTTSDSKTLVGDRYLSIVLPKAIKVEDEVAISEPGSETLRENQIPLCTICKQPLSQAANDTRNPTHESSIAHQLCLEHSHPPSYLDREHMGVKYLSSYGWDPDGRRGLGMNEGGIRIPIKAKAKHDTLGLGVDLSNVSRPVVEKPVRLNAKEIRIQEIESRKKAEKLRQNFYGKDLQQFLGPEG